MVYLRQIYGELKLKSVLPADKASRYCSTAWEMHCGRYIFSDEKKRPKLNNVVPRRAAVAAYLAKEANFRRDEE